MKKRWFVVILTIGLLLHVLPLSVLALSPDPTITDSDGTILDWSDLSTVPYSLDDLQEQEPPVPDLSETGSEKSLADADNDEEAADDRPTVNLTLKTLDEESDDEESGDEESGDEESDDDDPADAGSDKATADDLPTVNLTPKTPDEDRVTMTLRTTTAAPQPRLCARSAIFTTLHWTRRSARRCLANRSTC